MVGVADGGIDATANHVREPYAPAGLEAPQRCSRSGIKCPQVAVEAHVRHAVEHLVAIGSVILALPQQRAFRRVEGLQAGKPVGKIRFGVQDPVHYERRAGCARPQVPWNAPDGLPGSRLDDGEALAHVHIRDAVGDLL